MVNAPATSAEDIRRYEQKLLEENSAEEEAKLQRYINKNITVVVQKPRLEDQPVPKKSFIREENFIKVTKSGIPEGVFKAKEVPKKDEPVQDAYQKVVLPHERRGETAEERLKRKQLTKEGKKLRKDQKRELKTEFEREKAKNVKIREAQRNNPQGINFE